MQVEEHKLVLVAEDHPVNQKVMCLLLDLLGISSRIVSNGKEAIDATEQTDYYLILMDLMMPEMDGFEAAFEIRKREFGRSKHTPIIACTAMDLNRVREQCIRSGFDDYILKPLGKEVLKKKIEAWTHINMSTRTSAQTERTIQELSESVNEEPIDAQSIRMLYGLEQLNDVFSLFLSVTQTLLAQLESGIQNKDIEVVKRMAHEIRGSSCAVSAKEMSQLCLRLEQAGEKENWSEAERLYTALALAFARVREFITSKAA